MTNPFKRRNWYIFKRNILREPCVCVCVCWCEHNMHKMRIRKFNLLQNQISVRSISCDRLIYVYTYICKTLNVSVLSEVVVLRTENVALSLTQNSLSVIQFKQRVFMTTAEIRKKENKLQKKEINIACSLARCVMRRTHTRQCIDSYLISGIKSILIRKFELWWWPSAERDTHTHMHTRKYCIIFLIKKKRVQLFAMKCSNKPAHRNAFICEWIEVCQRTTWSSADSFDSMSTDINYKSIRRTDKSNLSKFLAKVTPFKVLEAIDIRNVLLLMAVYRHFEHVITAQTHKQDETNATACAISFRFIYTRNNTNKDAVYIR